MAPGRGVDAGRGGTRVGLNVFGPNAVARALYDSLGYRVMATAMYKDLALVRPVLARHSARSARSRRTVKRTLSTTSTTIAATKNVKTA